MILDVGWRFHPRIQSVLKSSRNNFRTNFKSRLRRGITTTSETMKWAEEQNVMQIYPDMQICRYIQMCGSLCIMYASSGICPGGIFVPSRCPFFKTLAANYNNFLHANTALNWFPRSIMSAGPRKIKFWTCRIRFSTWKSPGNMGNKFEVFQENFHLLMIFSLPRKSP